MASVDAQENIHLRRLPPVHPEQPYAAPSNAWKQWQFELEEPPRHQQYPSPMTGRPVGNYQQPTMQTGFDDDSPQYESLPLPNYHAPPVGDGSFTDPQPYPQGDYSPLEADSTYHIFLPSTLLWEVPLANQRAPRMYGKFTNLDGDLTFETAIGTQFGLWRRSSFDRPDDGIQLDFFSVVFTRFNNNWDLITSDFRVGIPLTFARDQWQYKLSYEHSSSHLGDEFIESSGQNRISHNHDELVAGIARRFPREIRLYGQYAYSLVGGSRIDDDKNRFNLGIEWNSRCGQCTAKPFAAADLDLRSGQGYQANITLQAGWQWRDQEHGRATRVAFEYYDGKSPYGQFYLNRERWISLSLFYDW